MFLCVRFSSDSYSYIHSIFVNYNQYFTYRSLLRYHAHKTSVISFLFFLISIIQKKTKDDRKRRNSSTTLGTSLDGRRKQNDVDKFVKNFKKSVSKADKTELPDHEQEHPGQNNERDSLGLSRLKSYRNVLRFSAVKINDPEVIGDIYSPKPVLELLVRGFRDLRILRIRINSRKNNNILQILFKIHVYKSVLLDMCVQCHCTRL